MFGIGMQEMVIIGLLFLIIFGPNKLPVMARDFGRFVSEARRSVEEFKDDLVSEKEVDRDSSDDRRLEAIQEPGEDVRREQNSAVARSAPPAE